MIVVQSINLTVFDFHDGPLRKNEYFIYCMWHDTVLIGMSCYLNLSDYQCNFVWEQFKVLPNILVIYSISPASTRSFPPKTRVGPELFPKARTAPSDVPMDSTRNNYLGPLSLRPGMITRGLGCTGMVYTIEYISYQEQVR